MRKKISLVVPCYNEQEALPIFFEEIEKVVCQIEADIEYILVDDGSKDDTWKVIESLAQNFNIKAISFSRNFGKEAALLAGLKEAKGDYVAVMDVDLQDPPHLLKEMFTVLETTDYDIVGACRKNRKGEPFVRSVLSNAFYKLMAKSKVDMPKGARDFRLMRAKVVDAYLGLEEYNRFSKGMLGWVGFKTKWIQYENVERSAGKTKYSLKGLFSYAIDCIFGFTSMPLALLYFACVVLGLASFGMLITMIVQLCVPALNFNTLFLTLFCVFFTGFVVVCGLAVVTNYLHRILSEVRCRPKYIIAQKINIDK